MRGTLRRLIWVMIGRSMSASNPIRAMAGRVGGVLSIAIGIISIPLGLIPCVNVLAVLLSLVGLGIGVLAYRQSRLALSTVRYAVAGIIFSVIAFFTSIGVSRSLYDKWTNPEGVKNPAHQNDDHTW